MDVMEHVLIPEVGAGGLRVSDQSEISIKMLSQNKESAPKVISCYHSERDRTVLFNDCVKLESGLIFYYMKGFVNEDC